MENLLREWGFQEYIEIFNENEIDLESLKEITEEMLKEIIVKSGPRAKFLAKLKVYQTLQKAPLIVEGSDVMSSTVKKILNEAEEGPAIISSYGAKKQFLRNTLCNLIIRNELNIDKSKSIPRERFIKLAKEINDIFPHEDPETYYVPYVNTSGTPKAARGKLWNTYIHLRRRFRNLGLIASTSTENSFSELKEHQAENEEESHDKMLWLKNNSTPINTVLKFWNDTFHCRKALLNSVGSIDSYINRFPVLKEPHGFILFEKDFELLYPEKNNLLFNCWPKIAKALTQHLHVKKINAVLAVIEEFESRSNEKLDFEQLSDLDQLFILTNCLPMMFTSAPIKAKSQRWRPSKLEMKQGFVLQVKDAADMRVKLELRKQKYELYGLSMQPIPIIIGELANIEACYVNINQVFYRLDTPLKAIDTAFKIIHVLDAEYPPESKLIWLFLQQTIYRLNTSHDPKFTAVSTLQSDLKVYISD